MQLIRQHRLFPLLFRLRMNKCSKGLLAGWYYHFLYCNHFLDAKLRTRSERVPLPMNPRYKTQGFKGLLKYTMHIYRLKLYSGLKLGMMSRRQSRTPRMRMMNPKCKTQTLANLHNRRMSKRVKGLCYAE